jgi:hypothetical protein
VRSPAFLAYAACLAPVVVFAVRILGMGWAPQGDAAVIGLKALAVLDGNFPFLGQWTTGAVSDGHVRPHHPGPVYSYLLAPALALSGGAAWGLLLGSVLVLCGTLVLTVRAARWAAGDKVACAVGAALGLATLVLAGATVVPWNPYPAALLLPAAALLTICLLRGEWRALPWWILAISVAAQNHAGTAIPAAVLCVPAGWALARALGRRRAERPLPLAVLAGSAAVAALLWLPVVLEVLRDHPNNVQALLTYAANAGVERFGWVAAFAWTTIVLGPGPLDVVGFLASGPGYVSWLTSRDTPPVLLLLVAATRPAGLVLLGAATLLIRQARRRASRVQNSPRAGARAPAAGRPLTDDTRALIPPLLVVVASIWALSRADAAGDAAEIRGLYALLAAPTLLVLAVLTLRAARPELRRRWPRLAARWRGSRLGTLGPRPLMLALTGLWALLAAVLPPRLDSGLHAPELTTAVRAAASGQRPVEILSTGPGSGLALSTVAYALHSAGHHYALTSADFLDADFTAYRTPAPAATRIAVVGTDGAAAPPPPPGDWELVGKAPRDQIFTNAGGWTFIYRSR